MQCVNRQLNRTFKKHLKEASKTRTNCNCFHVRLQSAGLYRTSCQLPFAGDGHGNGSAKGNKKTNEKET